MRPVALVALVGVLGCETAPTAPEAAESGSDASAPDAADTAVVDTGVAIPDGYTLPDRDPRCPSTPPKTGPASCEQGLTCRYYEACFAGGAVFVYRCVWPFDQPRQWVATSEDCSAVLGPDGCPLSKPLAYTLCTKLGVRCKYKTCVRSVCAPEDGGLQVWKPDLTDCATDAGTD